jgi:GATA zinc finger
LKNAIEQQFVGSGGVLRQNNIEKRRVYNLPQWREVCESTDHQPPAKRGEVRQAGHIVGKRKAKPKKKANRKKAKQVAGKAQVDVNGASTAATDADGNKAAQQQEKACENCWTTQAPVWRKAESGGFLCNACGLYLYKRGSHRTVVRPEVRPACLDNPPTEQPSHIPSPEHSSAEDQFAMQIDKDADAAVDTESMNVDHPVAEPITRPHTPLSPPTLKRKRSPSIGPEGSDSEAEDDADDFQNFDYRISNASEYTVERCKELERFYWKTVTFNSPMYGADMPGSLFDDSTETWNVAKLDNLLCRIGKTIPGVNSAYLYLGMWKATFSWHVEVFPPSHCIDIIGYGFVLHQLHSLWSTQTVVLDQSMRCGKIRGSNAIEFPQRSQRMSSIHAP